MNIDNISHIVFYVVTGNRVPHKVIQKKVCFLFMGLWVELVKYLIKKKYKKEEIKCITELLK